MRHQDLLIDGQWLKGRGTFDVTDPFDGEVIGTAAVATPEHATQAVAAAYRAMQSPLTPVQRSKILARTAAIVAERRDAFADQIRAEAGKPITAALAEVDRAITTLSVAAEEARRLPSETVQFDDTPDGRTVYGFTVPMPVGVVAAITPFNFPLNLVCHKVAPSLAAGCAVVLKPSERTPLSSGLLAAAFIEAGLPAGWINVVTGNPAEIVGVWTEHPDIAVVNFTGSAQLGWQLRAASPRKQHILELGSNTSLVVDESADLTRAVEAVVSGGFAFAGQACISVQRVYVHEAVKTEFVDRLVKAVSALPFGDPRDPNTVVGPLVSPEAAARVSSWVAEAVAEGATIGCGGSVTGSILEPTVLVDVAPTSSVVCQELFGPVVSVRTVRSVGEGIREVNDSPYGLNTAIYTSDIPSALTYVREAEAGSVMINVGPTFRADHMPYAGVKESGLGREGVKYVIAELTDARLVILAK
jgi:acyl-CoA reductase-like NAD-dependent aldehyde dehydrogenase